VPEPFGHAARVEWVDGLGRHVQMRL
jgi:hypothetical protein